MTAEKVIPEANSFIERNIGQPPAKAKLTPKRPMEEWEEEILDRLFPLKLIQSYLNEEGPAETISTGVESLDAMFGGWTPGRLYVFAAYVGNYKTRGGLALSKNAAKAGMQSIFIPVEGSEDEAGGIALLGEPTDTPCELPIHMPERIKSITEIKNLVRAFKKHRAEGKPFLVTIDFLQRVKIEGKESTRDREVTQIAEALSDLARETGAIIIALAQIGRSGANSKAMPGLHHLRESGGIEQAADVVVVHVLEDNKLRCKCLKNRWGKAGTEAKLVVDFENLTLTSYTEKDKQEDFLNLLQQDIEDKVIKKGPIDRRVLQGKIKLKGRHPKTVEITTAISRSHLVRMSDDGKTVEVQDA